MAVFHTRRLSSIVIKLVREGVQRFSVTRPARKRASIRSVSRNTRHNILKASIRSDFDGHYGGLLRRWPDFKRFPCLSAQGRLWIRRTIESLNIGVQWQTRPIENFLSARRTTKCGCNRLRMIHNSRSGDLPSHLIHHLPLLVNLRLRT